MVHGSLSVYRLARLIKYSFYKNLTLAFLLFYLQGVIPHQGLGRCMGTVQKYMKFRV